MDAPHHGLRGPVGRQQHPVADRFFPGPGVRAQWRMAAVLQLPQEGGRMTPWMRKLHKWVGLIIALQFVLWTGSGLIMSLLDHDTVQGHTHRAHAADESPAWPDGLASPARVLAGAGRPVQTIDTHWLGDRPVYRLGHMGDVWLASAETAQPVVVAAADVAAIAPADYVGDGGA